MKIKYFGHSCFLIENLLVDPFIINNPHLEMELDSVKCDIVCVTHDHADHLGDAFQIAEQNNATIVAIHEISELASSKGLKSEGMNIGGRIRIGDWDIKMVDALHSSGIGHPAGFILKNTKEGKTIYHAGDTGLFGDMSLIGDAGIDIAILPVGDRYTMGTEDAIKAVELIKPRIVVPMHYGTFPVINSSPEEFEKKCPIRVEVFDIEEEKNL